MKKISLEEFGLTHEKAVELLKTLNADKRKIGLYTEDGSSFYFLLEPEQIELLNALNTPAKLTEEIGKMKIDINNVKEKLTLISVDKKIGELEIKEKVVIPTPITQSTAETNVGKEQTQTQKEQQTVGEEEKSASVEFFFGDKDVNKDVVETKEKNFECPNCHEVVNVKIPVVKDGKGNLHTRRILRVPCPKCKTIIYEDTKLYHKVSAKKALGIAIISIVAISVTAYFIYRYSGLFKTSISMIINFLKVLF